MDVRMEELSQGCNAVGGTSGEVEVSVAGYNDEHGAEVITISSTCELDPHVDSTVHFCFPDSIDGQEIRPALMDFKEKAEQLIRMTVGFTDQEMIEASTLWTTLGKAMLNQSCSAGEVESVDEISSNAFVSNPTENSLIEDNSSGNAHSLAEDSEILNISILSPVQNLNSIQIQNQNDDASSESQQDQNCNSTTDTSTNADCLSALYEMEDADVEEILNNVEVDLGPAEELLLKSTSSKRSSRSNSPPVVQKRGSGGIVIVEHDTDTEVVINTRSANKASNNMESRHDVFSLRKSQDFEHGLFEDPLQTWKCKYCPKEFDDWIIFQNHQPSHKKVHRCSQCDTEFTTKGNLNVHKRIHTGEKPFICVKCSARFATSGNLRRHLLTHQGLKPYNCSICNSKFTEKKSLLIHQRSRHSGEKPFKCEDCGQGFSQSSILNTHKLIHSNKKPFTCCKCGHTFRQKSSLRLHESRHAGLKNYICTHEGCSSAFVTKADMDRHLNSHRGQKMFPCDTCGRSFMRKYTLKKHVNTKHPNMAA